MPNYHFRHNFNCLIADGSDPTVVKPSNWNDEHAVIFDAPGVLAQRPEAGSLPAVMPFADLTVIVTANITPLVIALMATAIGNFTSTSVPQWALKLAFAAGTNVAPAIGPGILLNKVLANKPAFSDDPIMIRLDNQIAVTKGDPLYTWFFGILGVSAAQMADLMTQAAAIGAAG